MFVFEQYDQATIDNQYNNRLHVPGYAAYLNRWELLSRQTEKSLPVKKDIAYGNVQREKLDIYPAFQPKSKTLIFIHGGYWQMLDKSMFHFIASGFHAYGVTTVLLNYPLAPDASVHQIVLSCRNAIKWLYINISGFNGDPDQMYVAGHSAGGHLAAMLMATNWKLCDPRISANVLKGICTVSGLFNLAPIYFSYVNKVVKMDMETATSNSPLMLEPLNSCPLIVAVGDAETEAFNEQSKAFYTCWKNKGVDIELLQLPGQNHYSVADAIVDPQSSLHQGLLRLMKIA